MKNLAPLPRQQHTVTRRPPTPLAARLVLHPSEEWPQFPCVSCDGGLLNGKAGGEIAFISWYVRHIINHAGSTCMYVLVQHRIRLMKRLCTAICEEAPSAKSDAASRIRSVQSLCNILFAALTHVLKPLTLARILTVGRSKHGRFHFVRVILNHPITSLHFRLFQPIATRLRCSLLTSSTF